MTLVNCPVAACPQRHSPDKLMCKDHWYSLPKDLRDEVWRTWSRRLRADDDEYDEAVRAHRIAKEKAVAHCEGREPDLEWVEDE